MPNGLLRWSLTVIFRCFSGISPSNVPAVGIPTWLYFTGLPSPTGGAYLNRINAPGAQAGAPTRGAGLDPPAVPVSAEPEDPAGTAVARLHHQAGVVVAAEVAGGDEIGRAHV